MQKASTAPSHGGAFDVSFFADVFRDARHYGVRDDLVEGGLTRSPQEECPGMASPGRTPRSGTRLRRNSSRPCCPGSRISSARHGLPEASTDRIEPRPRPYRHDPDPRRSPGRSSRLRSLRCCLTTQVPMALQLAKRVHPCKRAPFPADLSYCP
jgi:hypothetical protein